MLRGRRGFDALAALVLFLVVGSSTISVSHAQGFFCPGTVGSQSGIALQGGACTNGTTGAFSNAALAAQALSDVSQAATLQSTQATLVAISARRRVEAEACPEGYVRRNDTCERLPETAETRLPPPTPPPTPPSAPAPTRRPAPPARTAAPVRAPVFKAPVVAQPAVTFATWVKGYGDYERRTGTAQTSIDCCTSAVAGGIPNALSINSTSTATTGGVLGGLDATWRGVAAPDDGFIAGLLVGYMSTNTKLVSTSTSATPSNVPSGSGTLNSHMTGPSVGGYLVYFWGGFSTDLTFKVDFLDLNLNFTDLLGFSANVGVPTTSSFFSGSGSTNLNDYTTAGNLNYRFPVSGAFWVQPTVGFLYTATDYASSASAFGLANGNLFRVQGGAVFGTDFYLNEYRITPSVTGLLYDDVRVSGGFISGGLFSTVPLGLADEGKIRGDGIFTLNVDSGHGLSGFIQGEIYGGANLTGYAGRGGLRWQWPS